jgi:hypothetical protein
VISFFRKRVEIRTSGFGPSFGRGPGFGRTVYDVRGAADADITDVADVDETREPPEPS